MSINPGSDIVVDVMKAADPARAEQMTARLDALGAMSPVDPTEFATALSNAGGGGASAFNRYSAAAQSAAVTEDPKAEKAKTAFEATIINNFVKEMLPKNAEDVYGKGEAGDLWRTMLSEQISNQIAKNGAFGISKKLFATHGLHSHGKTNPASSQTQATNVDAVQASSNPLSAAPTANIDDGAFLFNTKAAS